MTNMNIIDSWDNEDLLIEYLGKQLLRGRLLLFLGAGISRPIGLPDWGVLIERMRANSGVSVDPGLALSKQAEIIEAKQFSSDRAGFAKLVKDSLYEGADFSFSSIRQSAVLSAIGALVMASKRGAASAVITLNFDDLLETYLESHGFVTCSAFNEVHWRADADVTVYHPHGFLPFNGLKDSSEITLTQRDFSEVIGDSSRRWNQLISVLLGSHTTLFLGLSGDDANLDSLLSKTFQQHPGLNKVKFFGVTFATDINDRATLWERRHVWTQKVADYEKDLPTFLFRICESASVQRQRMLAGIGGNKGPRNKRNMETE